MAGRQRRGLRVGRASVASIVLAAATALVAGTAVALLGFVFPDLGGDPPAPASEPCADPPCAPASLPSGAELLVSLPAVVPVLLAGAALLLAAVAAAMLVSGDRTLGTVVRCVLLVGGPLLVLVGAEVVPHLATPCWAGEVPAVCEATEEDGTDYVGSVHPFGHALLGWVPLTILYVWVLRRSWPDVVPRWVPGADRRTDALLE